ncbi:MAG: hypothetical protein MMC33_006983 [Icmadophila ericetorum]|nr:hypothetical protein [Icmadophila ericetorum]
MSLDIVISISATRGSASQYQELLEELSSLQSLLRAVASLQLIPERQDDLNSIKETVKACQAILGKNKRKLEKYHSSLGAGKSNGLFHDAAKKVKWMFFVKSDVPELRARLAYFVGILNTQISLEDRLANATLSRKIQSNHDITDARPQRLSGSGIGLRDGILRQASMLRSIEARFGEVQSFCHRQLNTEVIEKLRALQMQSTPLDTRYTWFQPPIRFEDPFGHLLPFPREFDYYILESWIRSWFEPRDGQAPRPGYDKILAGEYELFDTANATCQITKFNFSKLTPEVVDAHGQAAALVK